MAVIKIHQEVDRISKDNDRLTHAGWGEKFAELVKPNDTIDFEGKNLPCHSFFNAFFRVFISKYGSDAIDTLTYINIDNGQLKLIEVSKFKIKTIFGVKK